jgi:hypothetical protein
MLPRPSHGGPPQVEMFALVQNAMGDSFCCWHGLSGLVVLVYISCPGKDTLVLWRPATAGEFISTAVGGMVETTNTALEGVTWKQSGSMQSC